MTFDLLQVVYLCVQSCAWDWGEHPLAALRAVWGRAERQGDQNLVFAIHFSIFSTNIFPTSLINFFTLINCAGDPGLADEQVQRLRFCHHDQLWGGPCRHSGKTLGVFAYNAFNAHHFSPWTATLLETGFSKSPLKPTTGRSEGVLPVTLGSQMHFRI